MDEIRRLFDTVKEALKKMEQESEVRLPICSFYDVKRLGQSMMCALFLCLVACNYMPWPIDPKLSGAGKEEGC